MNEPPFDPNVLGTFENTEVADAVILALASPPGRGVVNELLHDGPYRDGVFPGFKQIRGSTSATCPYCKSPVLCYEYPEIGLIVFICREVGFFMRQARYKMRTRTWRRLVRKTAATWTGVEADRKGGRDGGPN